LTLEMTKRRLIGIFLGWHLFAISVGALPPSERLSNFPPRDPSSALNPVFYRVTVALDGAARGAAVVERALLRATSPVRRLVAFYLRITGLGQTWAMFANPPTYAQYMRVRYYVNPPSGRTWTATELVLPSNREDRVRTFQSFRDSYRDKALAMAMSRFYTRRKADLIAPGTRPEQLPTELAPVARYFSREFARTHLASGAERIVRTEVWAGTAPIPPLGEEADSGDRLDRAVALENYYDGPIEQRINVPTYPPYHAGEREADIDWLLEYYEEH
jgi:hypothetical protein